MDFAYTEPKLPAQSASGCGTDNSMLLVGVVIVSAFSVNRATIGLFLIISIVIGEERRLFAVNQTVKAKLRIWRESQNQQLKLLNTTIDP